MKIGLDIGGSHIAIGVINNNYELILKEERDIKIYEFENPSVALYNNIIQIIEKILEKTNIEELELIGLASAGSVENGKIVNACNLNITNMEIVNPLEHKFKTKVLLRNDAKCAALAEKKIGSIKNFKDAVFLTIGTGIGGAVFMDGKMLSPKRKSGFEIGHIVIDVNGEKCTCGRNGCFETLASMRKFKKDIKEKLNLNPDITGKEMREMLENKKYYNIVEDIINMYIHNLSIGLINLVKIFEPEVISIGGGFTYYRDIFLNKLKTELDNNIADMPKLVMASLGNEAGIIGAVINDI